MIFKLFFPYLDARHFGDGRFVFEQKQAQLRTETYKLGNPTTYRGQTAVWDKGRRLRRLGSNNLSYDALGRLSAEYNHEGKMIFANGFLLAYDETGVCGAKYLGDYNYYVFRKDAQGNICALLDTNGNLVVQYKYDAWGNCKVFDANGMALTCVLVFGIAILAMRKTKEQNSMKL